MENKELTILDECKMEGAAIIMQRYAHYLRKHLHNAVTNYESTDFDKTQFLADVAYALENADVVKVAVETITSILTTMRAEVAPIFDNENEQEDEK